MSAPPLAQRLPAWSLFGGMLAAAGLPIYIYAPPFYAQTYGVSLTGIAAVLFWLRLFDAVQDPLLGWLSERLIRKRGKAVQAGAGVLAGAMLGLFAIPPQTAPLLWFAITITLLFSAYSFLSITFYAQGVQKAGGTYGASYAPGRLARKWGVGWDLRGGDAAHSAGVCHPRPIRSVRRAFRLRLGRGRPCHARAVGWWEGRRAARPAPV